MKRPLSWIEIDAKALSANLAFLRDLNGGSSAQTLLCVPVKANAYGHGLSEIVRLLKKSKVEYIAVHSVEEAKLARKAGWRNSILSVGYIQLSDTAEALALGVEPIIYNTENLESWRIAANATKTKALIHLKIETGAGRQGITLSEIAPLAETIKGSKNLTLQGVATHFANVEDTTDHSFAKLQLKRFNSALTILKRLEVEPKLRHTASSAAHLVFPRARFDMSRPGIAVYGHWPSKETFLSFGHNYPDLNGAELLKPVLSFRTRIAQIKTIKKGETVGYGLTYRASRKTRIAVLPVGYYDGLNRGLSNIGHVLIAGQRASVLGRVSMNNIMVDVTQIRNLRLEDTATLIGRDGQESITAEQIAVWLGTIQYEVLAGLGAHISRQVI